jgi:hypothetical protein
VRAFTIIVATTLSITAVTVVPQVSLPLYDCALKTKTIVRAFLMLLLLLLLLPLRLPII